MDAFQSQDFCEHGTMFHLHRVIKVKSVSVWKSCESII